MNPHDYHLKVIETSRTEVLLTFSDYNLLRQSAAKDILPAAAEKDMVRSMLSDSLQAVVTQTLMKRKVGGRIAAHEIMIGTPAIRNLIREDKVAQIYSVLQTGSEFGMKTLDQSLRQLVDDEMITLEVAKEKAVYPEYFQALKELKGNAKTTKNN